MIVNGLNSIDKLKKFVCNIIDQIEKGLEDFYEDKNLFLMCRFELSISFDNGLLKELKDFFVRNRIEYSIDGCTYIPGKSNVKLMVFCGERLNNWVNAK